MTGKLHLLFGPLPRNSLFSNLIYRFLQTIENFSVGQGYVAFGHFQILPKREA